jgi:hypothetical protein
MKDDAIGAAARMQGYDARLGLGMTRIKNQINEAIPRNGNNSFLIQRFMLHLFGCHLFDGN